jgi:hypothetical protein
LKHLPDIQTLPSADAEIEADELAFDILLDYYGREQREVVESVCIAVFLLVRYFMWLRIVYVDDDADAEFSTWLRRNNFFREKFSRVYHQWGPAVFIVDLMEQHLEPLLETGSLEAAEGYKKLLEALERAE